MNLLELERILEQISLSSLVSGNCRDFLAAILSFGCTCSVFYLLLICASLIDKVLRAPHLRRRYRSEWRHRLRFAPCFVRFAACRFFLEADVPPNCNLRRMQVFIHWCGAGVERRTKSPWWDFVFKWLHRKNSAPCGSMTAEASLCVIFLLLFFLFLLFNVIRPESMHKSGCQSRFARPVAPSSWHRQQQQQQSSERNNRRGKRIRRASDVQPPESSTGALFESIQIPRKSLPVSLVFGIFKIQIK